MPRALISFWVFLALATLLGGLMGRYVGAFIKGYGSPSIALVGVLLTLLFAFSMTVLIRIVRASAEARRLQRAREVRRHQ